MEAFVTVATFMWPTEAVVPRSLLEEEGIEVSMKDEMTVQVHNLYSQAIGGVKIQVREADAERAKELLRNAGFLHDTPTSNDQFWTEVDEVTRQIPLIGRIDVLLARVMVLLTVVLFIVIIPLVLSAQPSVIQLLTAENWCVDRIQVNGEDIEAYSTSDAFVMATLGCPEQLSFYPGGSVKLPGFNTPYQTASWVIKENALYLEDLASHHDVYGGAFAIAVDDRELTLRSARTIIYCTKVNSW
jgi:hypothetical protein